jgi:hypothetical protein
MAKPDFLTKKLRGGQRRVDPQLVLGTADVFRAQFAYAWPTLGRQLLDAKSSVETWEIVKSGKGIINNMDFLFSERIFQIIQEDDRFPKVRSKAQIDFLADSLAASGLVTPRRSREICAQERAKVRHVIVRREYYIECTCGYKGPARDGACDKCGTRELSDDLWRKEES